MRIKPLFNRILVKIQEETTTESGLFIVKKEDTLSRGTIVAVGPGAYFEDKIIPTTVKVGDEIIFASFNKVNVDDMGEKYCLVSENEILAIVL